ncbi:thiamine biosynthesis protein ThiS [candidate division BRC1 bacterium HGW-BRC1-1]|jgi:thiamine biosynthesis protein ThiS|nr:MAG: thiamine biosynthesis protein ThiS [candidate division BRC1 bacterium HGW-BRC1-1]
MHAWFVHLVHFVHIVHFVHPSHPALFVLAPIRSPFQTGPMMKLTVNGKAEEFDDLNTTADLLTALGIARERVAVMVNEDVVRRADLETHPLKDGDTVEVITMVGGG